MYLLDTNVVSELRKPGADRHVIQWVNSKPPSSLFLSVIVIYELEIGVLRKERHDHRQGAALRAWLTAVVLPTFADRLLSVDKDVAIRCARLHVPDRRPERDALIAATALVRNMTVVTRNTADFQPMNVPLLNPWLP